ncbi:MAG: hypothetical protein IK061_05595, partial [Desulfovibrio sp.]|nr:hypothetical protein [Desulfovibrio sp.]
MTAKLRGQIVSRSILSLCRVQHAKKSHGEKIFGKASGKKRQGNAEPAFQLARFKREGRPLLRQNAVQKDASGGQAAGKLGLAQALGKARASGPAG